MKQEIGSNVFKGRWFSTEEARMSSKNCLSFDFFKERSETRKNGEISSISSLIYPDFMQEFSGIFTEKLLDVCILIIILNRLGQHFANNFDYLKTTMMKSARNLEFVS